MAERQTYENFYGAGRPYAGVFTSFCPGTLGELYQGPFPDGDSIAIAIISAVSNLGTNTVFVPGKKCNLEALGKYKVKRVLNKFLENGGGAALEGMWHFKSELKVGAGMSSSTSDIISALRCLSNANGSFLTVKDICDSLLGVERSDSVFISHPCLYLSERQKIAEAYNHQSSIFCIYTLEAGEVDTSCVKEELRCFYKAEIFRYREMLQSVRSAFLSSNLKQVIHCSTQSALLSQEVIPKEHFNSFYKNRKALGADGIIVAHTGVLLGYLFHREPENKVKDRIKNFVEDKGLKACEGRIF